MNLIDHIERQKSFSLRTFGPGDRTGGVCAHITKEIDEILASAGKDLEEWIDVVILALDGAHRAGFSSHEIAFALEAKQLKNEARDWPDWREFSPDQPIEHVRGAEPAPEPTEFPTPVTDSQGLFLTETVTLVQDGEISDGAVESYVEAKERLGE